MSLSGRSSITFAAAIFRRGEDVPDYDARTARPPSTEEIPTSAGGPGTSASMVSSLSGG